MTSSIDGSNKKPTQKNTYSFLAVKIFAQRQICHFMFVIYALTLLMLHMWNSF